MVQIRLVEQFLIHDLDLQARFHYAPRDSKSHKVEQVMSYLNEALGDGRFISTSQPSLLENTSEQELLTMTKEKLEKKKEDANIALGYSCAKQAADRYEGCRALGTTIHARVPDPDKLEDHFFFDEEFMLICHKAGKKMRECAGSAYFRKLQDTFDNNYLKYDNGVEGIRKNGDFRCPNVRRIPPPVPNLHSKDDDGTWHYYHLDDMPQEFQDAETRQINDFCPRSRLNELVESCGGPRIITNASQDGTVTVKDKNETWSKIQRKLPILIDTTIGQDLATETEKEAESLYTRQLVREVNKLDKRKINPEDVDLTAIRTGSLKLKIKKSTLPNPLPWGGHIPKYNIELQNTCTIDNMLFFFHVVQTSRKDLAMEFSSSTLPVLRLLYDVSTQFKEGKWASGKHEWLRQFDKFSGQGIWDADGSEHDLFWKKMVPMTATTYTSQCCSSSCSSPVMVHTSNTISFRYIIMIINS